MTDKTCGNCAHTLPVTEFHKNCATRDGRHTVCKTCRCLHTMMHTDATYKRARARQHYAFMRCQTKAKRIAVRLVMDLETFVTGAERPHAHPLIPSAAILKRYVPTESLTAISNLLQAHLGSDMYWSGYNARWRLMCKSVRPLSTKDLQDKEGYVRSLLHPTNIIFQALDR